MKLILLRHAKSDWTDPRQEDHDRPLNRRGQDAARKVGTWLRSNGHAPDQILCSSAVRTRETLDRLGFDDTPAEYLPGLYLAPAETILAEAARAEAQTLLILSHNPGIAEAASRACTPPPAHPDFDRYPTCACTIIDAGDGLPGKPLAFLVPRDL